GDKTYKLLKKIFTSPIAQFLFNWLHPDIGIALAQRWSRHSRISNMKAEEKFKGEEQEFLLAWCRETEKREHHDYYIFGHRHLPLDLSVGEGSRYINLGEWVHFSPFAAYDGTTVELKTFNPA
ncbi:MAG: UDP-2,3-diacylglucosamine diphosphatase, partial [Bacteroidota bacterium]